MRDPPERHSSVEYRHALSSKRALRLGESFAVKAFTNMSPLLTFAQRTTALRRVTGLVSTEVLWGLWKQAPYLTSGGVAAFAAAIAVSKLFAPTAVEEPRRLAANGVADPSRESHPLGAWARAEATNRHAIGVALTIVLVTVASSEALERLVNRFFRPNAEEWTWIGDVVLSTALLVMTLGWARLKHARGTISLLDAQRLVLDTQLSIAADIQRALLPSIPEPLHGVHWYGAAEYTGPVGGDYFDFLALPDGKMVVVLADISGKGVPAAIFMSNVRAIVHTLVHEVAAPNELLTRLSRDVLADGAAGPYATCIIALVDPDHRTMIYSNAGHPAGVLAGPWGVHPLRAGGPPVGLLENAVYDTETLVFGDGDMVTLVSDGVSEALDVPSDLLPFVIAEEIVRAHPCVPKEICAHLLDASRASRGPKQVEDWSDDRTVVAFGVVAPADARTAGHSFSSIPNRSAIR